MLYVNKANHTTLKGKISLLVLVFILASLHSGTAAANRKSEEKTRSCKVLRSMARVHMAYGNYAKAQPLAERALTLAKKYNVPDSELCSSLIDLAYIYSHRGMFVEAEKTCKQGLEIQEKFYRQNHPYVAYTLRTLASIHRGQGEYQSARSCLDRAMNIMLEFHTADDPIIAPFKVDIAKLLAAQGQLDEAETYYLKALTLINNSYGPDHLYTTGVLGELARLYTLQERFLEAEPMIAKTLTIQQKVYGPNHHLIAPAWLTMAEIYRAKGDHTKAEKLIQKAVSAVEKTGNITALVKLQQRIVKIRRRKQVAFGPVAKALR